MQPVTISFLSTAHIHTKSFLDNIAQAGDGRRARMIWDDVEERGRRYAESAGAQFTADAAAVIHDPETDGFIICAENTRHLPLLEAVIPVGKPVFCEKPLVTSTADLKRVRSLLEQHPETTLFCGYFQPWSAQMAGIRRLIEEEAFGQITSVRYRNAHHAAYGRWFDNPDVAWFCQPALSGGGALIDLGTHALHLLRLLFGPADKVWAQAGNESGNYPEVEDYATVHLRFANGARGLMETSWTHTGGLNGLEITGSKKSLWNTADGYVTGAPGETPVPVPPGEGSPTRVDRLVAAVRGEVGEAERQADLAATMDAVAIVEAAYRSAKSGAWETTV